MSPAEDADQICDFDATPRWCWVPPQSPVRALTCIMTSED